MNRNKILLLVISVGLLSLGAYCYVSQLQPLGSTYGNLTIEQAAELIEANPSVVLLDVRTDWEFDSGHLEGAVNIPVDELEQRVDELDSEDPILVYCRTGNRSSSAVQTLRDNGFGKIYHLVDGIKAWMEAGYPVITD